MSLDPEPTRAWLELHGMTRSEYERMETEHVRAVEQAQREVYDRFEESLLELYGTEQMLLEAGR